MRSWRSSGRARSSGAGTSAVAEMAGWVVPKPVPNRTMVSPALAAVPGMPCWTRAGPDPKNLTGVYLEATYPKGEALKDPDYADGSGLSDWFFLFMANVGHFSKPSRD